MTEIPASLSKNKLKIEQDKLVKYIVLHIILFVVFIVLFIWSVEHHDGAVKTIANLQQDINLFNAQTTNLEMQIKQAQDAKELWYRITNAKSSDGLQIDKAKQVLKHLESSYLLAKPVDVNMSSPIELKDQYKTATTVIMSSDVTLKLVAPNDEVILAYVDSIIHNLPGFVKIRQLQLERTKPFDQSYIDSLNSGALVPELINGTVVFGWRDFKFLK
jgi:hypothetical protein